MLLEKLVDIFLTLFNFAWKRERGREKERQTDRQTDRHTERML